MPCAPSLRKCVFAFTSPLTPTPPPPLLAPQSGFAIANLNEISKTDINTYTKAVLPTEAELVKKLLGL